MFVWTVNFFTEVYFVLVKWPAELLIQASDAILSWQSKQWVKAIEIIAVFAAVGSFLIDLDTRNAALRESNTIANEAKDDANKAALRLFELERQRFFEERSIRAEIREQRMWAIATDPRPGNSGKIPALEFLNKNGNSLAGLFIPDAFLDGIDLSGADLSQANLVRATLTNSSFIGADFTDADLSEANLNNANLQNANLSGTILRKVKNLTQAQISVACSDERNPPQLPLDLVWQPKSCPERER